MKELRKKRGLTLAELGEEFDRGKTTFSNYENNYRKPNINLVNELADFFEVSVDYLLGREEEEQEEVEQLELVPIVDISMGQAILTQENIIGYKKVPQELIKGGEFFYLRITGDDSMINAGIQDGDLVLVNKEAEIENGDIALLTFGDELRLKYLYSIEDYYSLQAANPKYKSIIINHGEVEIIGKAVEVIRRL